MLGATTEAMSRLRRLTQALPIDESALYALEGEVYYVYNNNEYYSVVTPDQVRGNASSLADAVLHGTYTCALHLLDGYSVLIPCTHCHLYFFSLLYENGSACFTDRDPELLSTP